MDALSETIGRRGRARVVLSLTPLIDVVFILLVFFMLVSQFASWRAIDIIPQVSSGVSTSMHQTTIVVTVESADAFLVDGDTYSDVSAAAIAALGLGEQDTSYLVRPGDDVAIQPVVDLVEAMTRAGINNLRVETEGVE
ncbi:MAG: biopolymer transporter ExbD [Pseudomonadota bacterium]